MPVFGAFILLLIVGIPMLPSVLLTLLSAVALKRKRKFLYYNASFAATYNIVLLLALLLVYAVSMLGQKREDLWVLLALMPLSLIFSGVAFLFGYIGYKSNGSSDEDVKALPWYPLWMSVAAICSYPFLLIVIGRLSL